MSDDSRARAQVDRWELEWASAPRGHWGDRIEWGTARIIADRLDGKATDPFGPAADAVDQAEPRVGVGPESKSIGQVHVDLTADGRGLALLVEAAILFRSYEGHHHQREAGFREKAACAAGWRADEWIKDAEASHGKAERNGAIAARIEAYLQTIDSVQLVPALEAAAASRWGDDTTPSEDLQEGIERMLGGIRLPSAKADPPDTPT
jgi:hypothetical protein